MVEEGIRTMDEEGTMGEEGIRTMVEEGIRTVGEEGTMGKDREHRDQDYV